MDYEELIKDSRELGATLAEHFEGAVGEELQKICLDAADAIETLLAERYAAIKDIRDYSYNPCKVCIEWKFGRCSRPGPKDCGGYSWWKWRGPQKEGGA